MIDESNSPRAELKIYCSKRRLSTTQLNTAWKFCKYKANHIERKTSYSWLLIYYVHYLFVYVSYSYCLTFLPHCLHILICWVAVSRSFMHGGCRHIASYSSSLDECPRAVERPCTFRYGSAWRTTSVPHVQKRQWPPHTWTYVLCCTCSQNAAVHHMAYIRTRPVHTHVTTRAFLAVYYISIY